MGDIVNFAQHWMYCMVYYEAALLFRPCFNMQNIENVEACEKRQLNINTMNGLIYFIMSVTLVTEFFIETDIFLTTVWTFLSSVMAILLIYSMAVLQAHLRVLHPCGLTPMRKTIICWLVCLSLIAILNLSSLTAKIKYKQDCDDKVMEVSFAGIATRFFQMVVMLIWRIVTVTMVAFYLREPFI